MKSLKILLFTVSLMIVIGQSIAPALAQEAIRIATRYPTTTLDPSRSAAAGNIEVFGLLYATLLRRNTESGELEPALAERWEVSEDRLTYTFYLRKAQFSNGTPIDAADVVFSFERVRSDAESALPSTFARVESITALDTDIVHIKLKSPLISMLDQFSMWNAGIVSKVDIEQRGLNSAFTENPVTSGAYSVKEWRAGERLILQPNPHYWRSGYPKTPLLVELLEVAEPETALAMLKSGQVDVLREVEWSQMDELYEAAGIDMHLDPSHVIYVTLLNHSREPFSNLKARQAATHALNREAIARIVTGTAATPANTPLPGSLDYQDASYSGLGFDPNKAKQLLAESGMQGKEVKILLTAGQAMQQIALLMQAEWQKMGLKPVIVNVDIATWWDDIASGNYDATPTWWMNEMSDPYNAVNWALCGRCDSEAFYTFYNNESLNQLAEQAAKEIDPTKRAALYQQIIKTSSEEVAQIPLFDSPWPVAYAKRIKGLKLTPAMQWTLEETLLQE